jgi:hypothetical protein
MGKRGQIVPTGVYTLSLEGDAGAFRIWADDPARTPRRCSPAGHRHQRRGRGSFAGYPGRDLCVEAVSNGTATLTYAYTGTGDAAGIEFASSLKMTAWAVEFVHAEGDEVGLPMDGLPVSTDTEDVPVPDFAPWRLKIPASQTPPWSPPPLSRRRSTGWGRSPFRRRATTCFPTRNSY